MRKAFLNSACQYSNPTTASISVDGQAAGEVVLSGVSDDGQEVSFEYTSDTAEEITISIEGSGYLHSLSAETITPREKAIVSGSVSAESYAGSAAGQKLLFTDENGETLSTEISAGNTYSVELPVGNVYTAAFEASDIYEITEGGSIDLTASNAGDTVTANITYRVIWDTSKSFSFAIGGTTYTVVPGASSSEDFIVEASGGDGSVELATADTAIVWADLNGAGIGSLMDGSVELVSGDVEYAVSGNTIEFKYTDTSSSPSAYTVQVKDNSASGTPHANGEATVYDFGDGSIVSELYDGNSHSISGGKSVPSSDGLLTVTGVNGIYYNGAHGIVVKDGDRISVKAAGNAEIIIELCAYSASDSTLSVSAEDVNGTATPGSVSAQAAADGDTAVFEYTGEEGELTFTYNGSGSGYIHSLQITNELPETEITEQTEMPSVRQWGASESVSESAAGQRLNLTQEGGRLASGEALSESVGYYAFDPTSENNRLEADITLNSCGGSSANGVFFGVFSGTDVDAIGIRNMTNLRGMYTSSEDGTVHAGRIDEAIEEGQRVHVSVEKTDDGFVMTAQPQGGEVYTIESSGSDSIMQSGEVSFGFLLADASVTVTNMKYYNAAGDVLYDQNDCYEPVGTAPAVNSVQASASETRDSIIVAWNSSELADGDGVYVVQVSKDGGEWMTVAETADSSFIYPASEPGTYEFRVGGKLGNDGEVTYCENTAVVENFLPALAAPVLTLEADASSISLSWTASEGAGRYEIYRYSSDEGAGNAVKLAETAETTYIDGRVEQEIPYYYYVTAYAADDSNSSNPSATVWAMASSGHTGDYVYEEEAAGINLTEYPESTVYGGQVSFAGTADRAGRIAAYVNGAEAASCIVSADSGGFDFELQLSQGRNEIELIFTAEDGTQTRRAFSVVWITNYDIVVDAGYEGEDGTAVDGIPTYKTVQAAVDCVPADNTERQVIFIKAGDYNERLVVNSPYISLIGEDEDGVRIHCYPADLYPGDPGYEAGGDMSKRCAVYVTASAAGFSAENLTFANDYVYGTPDNKSNKSADALRCDADGAVFVNVTLSGVQDTLYMDSGSQYYYQCRIEGLIDFIYSGDDAKALFEDCEIVFVYEETHPDGGYVCAPRTAADAQYGLIFNNCVITSEEGCADGSFCLARPWGPDAAIYWIDCYMGSAINTAEAYDDMSGNTHEEARFFECGSYGPGYSVNADRRQISRSAADALLAGASGSDEAVQSLSDAYIGNIIVEPTPTPSPEPSEPTPTPSPEPSEPTPTPEPGAEPTPSPEPAGPAHTPGTEEESVPEPEKEVSDGNGDGNGNTQAGNETGGENVSDDEPKAESAETGDPTNSVLPAAAALISGLSACLVFIMNRKKM